MDAVLPGSNKEWLLGQRDVACDRLAIDHTEKGWAAALQWQIENGVRPEYAARVVRSVVKTGCAELESSLPSNLEDPMLGLSKAERAYIAATTEDDYDPTPQNNADVLAGGRDTCAELDEHAGDDLVRYLAEEILDYTAEITHLCPQFKDELARSKLAIPDGNYSVGSKPREGVVVPGTYRTRKRVSGCYWERVTDSGKIIDNDFVNAAPGGAQVTIRPGDGGFNTNGCDVWLPVR